MSLVTITYLEMLSPDTLRPKQSPQTPIRLEEVVTNQWQQSRDFYLAVGAPWNWNDKRSWSDEQWQAYAQAPQLRTYIAYLADTPIGYFELHTAGDLEVELAYFGLLPAFLNQQLGGPLLTAALQLAWEQNPSRVWVHTCDLDHPAALQNYQARGMVPYKVELHEAPATNAENKA